MIRSPEELTTAIKSAVNRRAVVASHLILAVTGTAHTVLWPSVQPYERNLAIFLSATLIIMILLRFFDLASINNRPLLYIVAYEVMTYIGITFLTEPSTPYVLLPVFTALIANLYYGARGVYVTVAVFGAATISKYLVFASTGSLTTENTLDIFAAFFIFAALSSLFVNIQKVFDWDRTRLKSLIREATIGQKRLRTLINSMTESVLVLDKNGVVRLYNAAALALFDTNTSLEGKKPIDFADMEDEKGNSLSLQELLPEGPNPITRRDIILRYTKEDFAALSMTVTPLRASFGQGDNYAGYILSMRDITRERSLEEERNEFISVISHELRTPVTVTEASLSNALMINDNQGGNEDVKKTLVTAHDQAVYLANMLNDLSTFARAEKGTLELNLEDINPHELVEHLENDYRNEAEIKGLHLESQIDDKVPKSIVSNRLYIREMLQNFITNAIKYSDSGTITISAHSNEDGGVKFSIADEGIGISKSDQKKVFNKFFRSEDFRTRSRNGTGLGLYIVRKLAKLLQASFDMESEVGKGSTFSLIVPDLKDLKESHTHHQTGNSTQEKEESLEQTVPVRHGADGADKEEVKTTENHPRPRRHAADYHVHHLQKQR